MKSTLAILLVLFLMGASVAYQSAVASTGAGTNASQSGPSSGTQKFGFGDSGLLPTNWVSKGYTCQSFYQSVFMTPPYPSVYVWQLGATSQWNQTGGVTQNLLDCLAGLLNSNQYMILLLGLNTGVGCCDYTSNALSNAEAYVNHLQQQGFTNQILIGLDGEHSQGMSQSDFGKLVSYIQSHGFKNANRYLGNNHNPYLNIVNDLQTTNWPFGDNEQAQVVPSGGYIGAFVGVIDGAPYPFAGCGPGYGGQNPGYGYPGWTDSPVSQGQTGSAVNSIPCGANFGGSVGTVQNLLASNAGNPDAQFVVYINNWICPQWPPQQQGGANCFGPYQILDSHFRNEISQWLRANPGIYLLGNSGSPVTTTTSVTSTSSTSSTTTSTSTSSSTSKTTSSTTSTTRTSSSSSTSSLTTTYVSTSTSSGQTSTVDSSSSGSTAQRYPLSVLGACLVSGGGIYPSGVTAPVEFTGVCQRTGGSGLRVASFSVDGGANVPINTANTVIIKFAMNRAHVLRLNSVPQYSLTLDYGAQAAFLSLTSTPINGDSYWYDSGTIVTYTGGVRIPGFNVSGWSLDGGSINPVGGAPDFYPSFVMDGPHSLQVIISPLNSLCNNSRCDNSHKFDVSIGTNTNLPTGFWVDGSYYQQSVEFAWSANSIHNVTAIAGVKESSDRSSFSSWMGIYRTTSPTLTLSANESGRLTATYLKQYLVSLTFVDSGGEPIVPQAVILKGPSGQFKVGTNLSAWVDSGAKYVVVSATWMNWNVIMTNDSSFTPSQASNLTFPLKVYVQTVKVTDTYDLPLSGATVNATTLNGVGVSAVTNNQGVAKFRIPEGLFSAVVSYLGVSDQIISSTEGSHSYSVSFILSYPLLATVLTVTAVSAIFVLSRRHRKRPGAAIEFFSD